MRMKIAYFPTSFLWKRIKVNTKIISIKIENSRWKQWSQKLVPGKDNKIGTPLARVTEKNRKMILVIIILMNNYQGEDIIC